MKLVFIGAGGLFREVCEYILSDSGFANQFKNFGVLDDTIMGLDNDIIEYLGPIVDHEINSNYRYLCVVGNVEHRERIYRSFVRRGGIFASYVHPSVYVAHSADISDGCIVCPNSVINANARVEENVLLNIGSSVAHDASVGASTVFSPYAAVNGGSVVGKQCFLGTRSTVFPSVNVAAYSTIDTHCYVKRDVSEFTIVSDRKEYIEVKDLLKKRKLKHA